MGPKSLATEVQAAVDAAMTKHMSTLIQRLEGIEQKFAAFEQKFAALEHSIKEKDTLICKLEKRVDALATENDALEQYGRRFHFRVENVEVRQGETPDSLQADVISVLQAAGVVISDKDVARLHRSSKPKEIVCEEGGPQRSRRVTQCIVKVNNWRVRELAHNSRNAARAAGHPIKQDLTKRRRDMIQKAREAIAGWGTLPGEPVWAYANINCEPSIRRGREVRKFRTDDELREALAHFHE